MQEGKFQNGAIFFTGLALIAMAIATRLLPHAANFTAIGAVALFAGYFFSSRLMAYAVVIVAMGLSDAILGFDSWLMRGVVYASLALPLVLGAILRKRVPVEATGKTTGYGVLASVGSGFVFYLTTNFAVWLTSGMYALTFGGLVQSYINAIPFYRNALAGDVIYTAALLVIFSMAVRLADGSEPETAPVKITTDK